MPSVSTQNVAIRNTSKLFVGTQKNPYPPSVRENLTPPYCISLSDRSLNPGWRVEWVPWMGGEQTCRDHKQMKSKSPPPPDTDAEPDKSPKIFFCEFPMLLSHFFLIFFLLNETDPSEFGYVTLLVCYKSFCKFIEYIENRGVYFSFCPRPRRGGGAKIWVIGCWGKKYDDL